jgi:Putative mono-oxygenase ydhR
MVMLQVNFDLDFSHNEDRAETISRARKHISEMPGLVWKLWLRDPETGRGGGFYLFKDRASADAWGKGRFETMAERMPWCSNVKWEYVEVDEELSRICQAVP